MEEDPASSAIFNEVHQNGLLTDEEPELAKNEIFSLEIRSSNEL
jgi:hypothetical protein